MAAYIAILLSSISIILLIVIIIKFKKLFSTDSIIEKTRIKMNKIISDINKNANMDIELINDASKRMRELIQSSDLKMEEFKEATRLLRDMIAAAENEGNSRGEQNHIYMKNSLIDDIKPIGKINNYGGTASALKAKAYQERENKAMSNGAFYSNQSGSMQGIPSEKPIPKIVTNIIPDNRNNSRKSLNDKVERLFRAGMKVDDIAMELSCSSSEVQFIIDMLNERG